MGTTVEDVAPVPDGRCFDIAELVAAIEGAEPPSLILEDEPRGDEVW